MSPRGVHTGTPGASLRLQFIGTRRVSLFLDEFAAASSPHRHPVLAWCLGDGEIRTHQVAPGDCELELCAGVTNPMIDFFCKGFSPLEDRFTGDVPPNSVRVLGFGVDAEFMGTFAPESSAPIWLNIGDSILAGDAALGTARPHDDMWALAADARASYGFLLASHFGYRESRIAFGGYNWSGGTANMPPLHVLIDHQSSTMRRHFDPGPSVVLINLGENGVPGDEDVRRALVKLRSRVGTTVPIVVMIPLSQNGRHPLTRAVSTHKRSDAHVHLLDLGPLTYATSDGQHPSVEGHQAIYAAVLPLISAVIGKA